MIDIRRAMKSNRTMKSLTGLSLQKFYNLLPYFELIIKEEKAKAFKNNRDRQRASGGGAKHSLDSVKLQLFYILFYLKVYPTFDLAGFFFDVDRSQTNRWTHALLPILEKTLGRRCVLPERKISNVAEFVMKFGELKDVFIDGTERRVQRPKDTKRQVKNYSGKKKTHTIKNIVMNDESKKILLLTPTLHGSMHDKKLYDKLSLGNSIPSDVTQWLDGGFLGVDKTHLDISVVMPKKKPKGKELTQKEKEENHVISSIRVKSEHAIGGMKRLRCVSDIYRNKKANVEDKFMVLSAGIWNLEIEKVA